MATLSDLTDPGAVLQAISEYDKVGQDAFLEKYGFGKATAYFLMHDGQRYDSKAIAGAALAFQHGTIPSRSDFSGGRDAAAARLEALGFSVIYEGKPPKWTRDELILALHVYFTRTGSIDEQNPEIQQLSKQLRSLHIFPDHVTGNPKFRNPSGVSLKLSNFLAVDPAHAGKGMGHVAQGDRDVFEEFSGDHDGLASMAATILAANAIPETAVTTFEEEELAADEGRLLFRLHRSRERNRKIVKAKKAAVLKKTGSLTCEVCGYDSSMIFGPDIRPIIDVHHVVPLHLAKESTTKLSDLALVCPTCHRAIHAHRPFVTPAELRQKIEAQKASADGPPSRFPPLGSL